MKTDNKGLPGPGAYNPATKAISNLMLWVSEAYELRALWDQLLVRGGEWSFDPPPVFPTFNITPCIGARIV